MWVVIGLGMLTASGIFVLLGYAKFFQEHASIDILYAIVLGLFIFTLIFMGGIATAMVWYAVVFFKKSQEHTIDS